MNSAAAEPAGTKSRPKHDRIVQTLRHEIVTGQLKPGDVLPGHARLAQRFGVSAMTVRLALRQLIEEGHLRTQSRIGTFVADRPPHLANYALVFPFDPAAPEQAEQRSWSKYYQAMTAAAVELQRELGSRLTLFHGVGYHADSEDRQRLLDLIRCQRLAGIIFVNSPHMLEGTPILDEPGIPRVELASEQNYPHVPAISFGDEHWLTQALERLEQRGRRRVAVLFNAFVEPTLNQINRAVAARGMVCPAYWQQAARWNDPQAVSHVVQLLMRGAAAERADGLLVMDDNLVEGVTAGLVAAGVRVPQELEVVAHANYPLAAAPVLPFHVLGYDLGAALRLGLELIDQQRQGATVAGLTTLPAVWREDWQVAKSSAEAMARRVSGRTTVAVP